MTYKETLDFLFSQLPAYHRIGKAAYRSDLNNTILLDDYFGHPHLKYRTVHVAGTNGKGSVSHMIASVMQEAGYRTGLYTSPHLKDFRERIRINGEMIPHDVVISFVEMHRKIIESLKPSFFEMTVAMALNYFAKCGVDVAIIETGLGGRLDSTNIIKPVLSVITNIGHDHMDLLGDTPGKIAVEKAGIIKPGIPVLISETQNETEIVFREKAIACASHIIFADKVFRCNLSADDNKDLFRKFSMVDLAELTEIKGESPLKGDYQKKNLQAAFAAFRMLRNEFNLSQKNLTDGIRNVISNTGLNGRWQILGSDPLIICDTGHNKEGLQYVLDQISHIPKNDLHIVIGFVNDKDLGSVLPLFPVNALYYFTRASVPRALNETVLKSEAEKYGLNGDSYQDVRSALEQARKNAIPSDLIFIGGSTFIVAEVI